MRIIVARKPHICHRCRRYIEVGEKCIQTFQGRWKGERRTRCEYKFFYYHPACKVKRRTWIRMLSREKR